MKLWVDDIRTPPDDTWHICRSVTSAIRALDMFWGEITHINLDHDISHQVSLGGMSRPYPCEETFEAVARYIARLPLRSIDIRIHTSNPAGADRMKKILEDVHYSPSIEIARGANRLETIL